MVAAAQIAHSPVAAAHDSGFAHQRGQLCYQLISSKFCATEHFLDCFLCGRNHRRTIGPSVGVHPVVDLLQCSRERLRRPILERGGDLLLFRQRRCQSGNDAIANNLFSLGHTAVLQAQIPADHEGAHAHRFLVGGIGHETSLFGACRIGLICV